MLKRGSSGGQLEHTPLSIIGFVNGHSTIFMDDLTLCFSADLKISKSFNGESKLGASVFVKNSALTHFELD